MRLSFRNKTNGDKVEFYQSASGEWFYKYMRKSQQMKKANAFGPFKDKGHALLSACMSKEFCFSYFSQL